MDSLYKKTESIAFGQFQCEHFIEFDQSMLLDDQPS